MTLFGGAQRPSKQRIPKFYPGGDPVNHMFCHNGSTPCGFSKHGCVNSTHGRSPKHGNTDGIESSSAGDGATAASSVSTRVGGSGMDCAHCKTENCTGSCTFPMYTAPGVDGPWNLTSAMIELGSELNPTGYKGTFSISAPWISPNGTTHIVLQTGEFPSWYPANLSVNNIGTVVRAETWKGPYTVVARGVCDQSAPPPSPSLLLANPRTCSSTHQGGSLSTAPCHVHADMRSITTSSLHHCPAGLRGRRRHVHMAGSKRPLSLHMVRFHLD